MEAKNNSYLFPAALTFIFALGVYFRIIGLDRWPVAVDEYYIIKSVQNILKTGLPEYLSGGYYERGIVYQYFVALLMLAGVKAELAARIIPVITNILTLIPLYLISRKLSNKAATFLIVFVFCFSVWEIEFARFGRMYSPFQMMFMYYLYFLFIRITENNKNSFKWMILISLISLFIYEGSIFLMILNFLPAVWNNKKGTFDFSTETLSKRKWLLLTAVIIFGAAYYYLSFDFRILGQSNLYPIDYLQNASSSSSQFRTPIILFSTVYPNITWLILQFIVLSVILYVTYNVIKQPDFTTYTKIGISSLLLLSFLNLYGLMIFLTIMFLLIDWLKPEQIKKSLKYILPVMILTILLWSAYIYSGSWSNGLNTINYKGFAAVKYFYKEFLNYPYFYETFVLFRNTIPWFTLTSIFFLAAGLFFMFSKNVNTLGHRFLYFILMLVLLIITFLNLTYFDTRYFLFLYPLIMILSITAVVNIIEFFIIKTSLRYTALAIVFIAVLLISEDFNMYHLLNIDSRNVNFRTGYSKAEKVHFYPRWDTRSPAEYINARSKSSDVIISNEQVNDLYLKKLTYIYRDYRNADFSGESVEGGKKERWTNANLIYSDTQFLNVVKRDTLTKWVLINTMWGTRHLKETNFFKRYKKYAVYANYDSSAIVYKISSERFHNQLSSK